MNAQTTSQTIGLGALAGASTALLCLGLTDGSVLSVILFFLSPVPLMIAGLGFGLKSALVGSLVALAGTLAFSTGMVAALVAIAIAGPACAVGYWLNLARPAEEIGGPMGKIAWYPLADVLFVNALMTGLAYIVLGAMIGYGPEIAGQLATELAARLNATDPQIAFTPEGMASLQAFLEAVIPFTQSFFWMLGLTLSAYVALVIATRFSLTHRPREDWTQALRMPRMATFAFLATVLVSMAPGGAGHAGASMAGALGAGFTIAGFAILHARTRGVSGRLAILLIAYLSIPLLGFTLALFFMAGIFGAGRHVALTPANPTNLTPTHNDD